MDGGHPADRGLVEDTSKHDARIGAIESSLVARLGDFELRLREVERTTHIWKAGLVIAGVLAGLCGIGSLVVMAAFAMMDRL